MIFVLNLTLILLFILFFEFLLRIFFKLKGKVYVWEPYRKIQLNLDHTALPQLPPISYFCINSLGEIGTEPPNEKYLKTLIIGGSAAECYFLGSDRGFTGFLQSKLNDVSRPLNISKFNKIHVGSIASSGLGADVLSNQLELILRNYKSLDLVICMLGANDLIRWFANGAPDSGKRLPIASDSFGAVNQKRKFTFKSIKSTAIFEFLKIIKRFFWRKIVIKKNVGSRLNNLRKMRSQAKIYRNSFGDPKKFITQYEKDLEATLMICKKKSKRVIVLIQPWFNRQVHESEHGQFWNAAQGQPFKENVEVYFSLEAFSKGMEIVANSTHRVASSLNIETIDLPKYLTANFENYYDFNHFTELGVERMTDIVIHRI